MAELGDEGLLLICDAVFENNRIQSLKLVRNKISDQGGFALLSAIENNSALHTLNLCNNNLSEHFLEKVIEMAHRKATGLKHIYINSNGFSANKSKKKIEELKKFGITITM